MPSIEEKVGEPTKTDKDYSEIIKSGVVVDPTLVQEAGQPIKIMYFCRDCEKFTTPKRVANKFQFKCSECNGSNVSFGSEKSIANYYRLKPKAA